MPVATYSAQDVTIVFKGQPITGFADGTFVRVERADAVFKTMVGASGEVARSLSANKSGKISITLMQTSASNDVLSSAMLADEASGAGIGDLQVKDVRGRTVAHAANTWVTRMPSFDLGRDLGHREWAFETDELNLFVGGN